MATDVRIGIVIDSKTGEARVQALGAAFRQTGQAGKQGLDKVGDALQRIKDRLMPTTNLVSSLKSAAAGLGLAFGLGEIVQTADKYSLLSGRLRLVTDSAEELANVQGRLYQQSQASRSQYEGSVELYARLARSTEDLHYQQSQLLAVTDTINKSMIVSGANATEANAAVIQFSQGLASGALRGDELRSVMEQTPRLARAIADGMGVTIGKLRELGADGELTSQKVIDALLSQGAAIDKEYSQMPKTIGQALTVVNNLIGHLISKGNESVGVTGLIASGIIKAAGDSDRWAASVGTVADALLHLGKIVMVGGALFLGWTAMPVIAATASKVFLALRLATATLSFAVMSGMGVWQLFNTSLFGTTIAATAATGALGLLKIAGGVLFAAFAGWQIGSWLHDNFETARLSGILMVDGLMSGWLRLKYGVQVVFAAIEYAWDASVSAIKNKFADFLEMAAAGAAWLPGIGDAVSASLQSSAVGLRAGGGAAESYQAKVAGLKTELASALTAHDALIDSMVRDAIVVPKVAVAPTGASAAPSITPAAVDPKELKKIEEMRANLTEKVKRLTLDEYEYRKWAIGQEVEEYRKGAKGRQDVLDLVSRYEKEAYAEVEKDRQGMAAKQAERELETMSSMFAKTKELILDEFEYRKWAIGQEAEASRQAAEGNIFWLSQVDEYERTALAKVDLDREEKHAKQLERDRDTAASRLETLGRLYEQMGTYDDNYYATRGAIIEQQVEQYRTALAEMAGAEEAINQWRLEQYQKLDEERFSREHSLMDSLRESWGLTWEEIRNGAVDIWQDAGQAAASVSQSIGSTITSIITTTQSAGEAVKSLFKSILSTAIQTLVQIGVQQLLLGVISKTAQAATTAAMVVSMGVIAAAAAPAAMLTSIATFGGSAAAGEAAYIAALGGMTAATAAMKGASAASGAVALAEGGRVSSPTYAWIAEEGYDEFVIPTDPRHRRRAMGLLAEASEAIGLGGRDEPRGGGSASPGSRGNSGILVDIGGIYFTGPVTMDSAESIEELGRQLGRSIKAELRSTS